MDVMADIVVLSYGYDADDKATNLMIMLNDGTKFKFTATNPLVIKQLERLNAAS